jgi:hypothetical protein
MRTLFFGFGVVCDAGGFACFCFRWHRRFGFAFAGIRGLILLSLASAVWFCFRWHPRYGFGLLALPLCGAAPTFLCRRKEK